MAHTVEQLLWEASDDGDAVAVHALLRDHPEVNANWGNENEDHCAALHIAASDGHLEVVKLLLAHPSVNVNVKTLFGYTAISESCAQGHVSLVQLLLKDPRVDILLADIYGHTPLWWASFGGHHEVVECLIASDRDLGDLNKKGKLIGNEFTALEIARNDQRTEVVAVLERFVADPTETRWKLRAKLGVLDELAAEVFALTVFLCDDLLQFKPASYPAATRFFAIAATRFFAIAAKLPMELQMVLCHRAVGSMKQNILCKDSEAAFKLLARILTK